MSHQGYSFAGGHRVDTHALVFDHNLSLMPWSRTLPHRSGRFMKKYEAGLNLLKMFEIFLISFVPDRDGPETLTSIEFRGRVASGIISKMFCCSRQFDVGMGNGMDFVHSLSTFTIP
jgi:hypothetical protein